MTTYDHDEYIDNLKSRLADIGREIKRIKGSATWETKKTLYDEAAAIRKELNEIEVDDGDTTFEIAIEGST